MGTCCRTGATGKPFGILGSVGALLEGELTGAMRLFVVRSDLAFTLLRPVSEASWRWRGGAPVSDHWENVELTVAEGTESGFIGVDCLELISGNDGPILSEFARDRLDTLLSPSGEFLPVSVMGRRYWWFNCVATVEALDRKETDCDWSVVDGDWGSFSWITTTRRLAFQPSRIASAPAMFRVPEYPQGVLFATEALTRAVEHHELTGFQLDVVWSAQQGGVFDPPGVGLGGVFDGGTDAELKRRRARARSTLERRGDVPR